MLLQEQHSIQVGIRMYYFVVAAFMFVLPIGSMAMESIAVGAPLDANLVVKWFVFWSFGGRLFTAGTKQIVDPAFTAKQILGLKSDESLVLVRELGFANVAMGALGLASLWLSQWRLGAALVGGIFFGLAGIAHLFQKARNRHENVAMVSDLFAAAVLLSALAEAFIYGR